ncbi:MAG: hypothetical protein ACM3N0_08420 [Chloroflexota bacterium]
MTTTPPNTVELDPALMARIRKAATERGVAVPQLVSTAIEHEIGDEAPQPPFSLIGAFRAGRSDLGVKAKQRGRS